MIVIIDYKIGNIGSLLNMLKKIGVSAKVSLDKSDIESADKLILPGVGAFDNGMKNLNEMGLMPILNKKVLEDKTPILGICLGMQLFTEKSEEGKMSGLGWIAGETKKFPVSNLKVPHMGWNTITKKHDDLIFKDMEKDSRFYFVHSYFVDPKDKNEILATTNYGIDFPSMVKKGNIYGAQFHPEKSHKFGMRLLENFAKLC